MIYCYECGEQVAKNDVFCPYCGISLSPQTDVEDETDVSSPTPAEAKPSQSQDVNFAESKTNRAEDFFNDVTAGNINLKAAGISESEIAGQKFESKPAIDDKVNNHDTLPVEELEKEIFQIPAPKISEPLKTIEATPANQPRVIPESCETFVFRRRSR